MLRNIFISILALTFIVLPTISHSQRSIGKVEQKVVNQENQIDIPIEDWVGERFIFLEKSIQLQEFGYSGIKEKKVKDYYKAYVSRLKYDKFVKKIAVVEDVIKSSFSKFLVILKMEQTGKFISATASGGRIEGMSLLNELENAKKGFVGDTVFQKGRQLYTYDEKLDEYGSFEVKMTEPLIVTDVWWGFDDYFGDSPLWLILETVDGQKGFLRFRFSWTNYAKSSWTDNRPWKKILFSFNPNEKYGWSEEIWSLVHEQKAQIGMNKEQVILSWGKPTDINKTIAVGATREQWVYKSGSYLYFDDEILTSIQN